jgi:hypothetical protein
VQTVGLHGFEPRATREPTESNIARVDQSSRMEYLLPSCALAEA